MLGGHGLTRWDYSVADGAVNMARDEALMAEARAGRSGFRFYGWEPWCLSLGRNQPAPARLLGRMCGALEVGTDIVRRPTGGRSVFHGPEVTYAFACPDRAWGGPRAVYARLHAALRSGLRALGVRLDEPSVGQGSVGPSWAGSGATDLSPGPAGCFRDPAPGEITVQGRKLVGSAQWRHRGALLQHGSILLRDCQALSDLSGPGGSWRVDRPQEPAVRAAAGCGPQTGARGPGTAIGLEELLEPLPAVDAVVAAIGRAIGDALVGEGEPVVHSPVPSLDVELVARYRDEGWQWRREAVDTAHLATR